MSNFPNKCPRCFPQTGFNTAEISHCKDGYKYLVCLRCSFEKCLGEIPQPERSKMNNKCEECGDDGHYVTLYSEKRFDKITLIADSNGKLKE